MDMIVGVSRQMRCIVLTHKLTSDKITQVNVILEQVHEVMMIILCNLLK